MLETLNFDIASFRSIFRLMDVWLGIQSCWVFSNSAKICSLEIAPPCSGRSLPDFIFYISYSNQLFRSETAGIGTTGNIYKSSLTEDSTLPSVGVSLTTESRSQNLRYMLRDKGNGNNFWILKGETEVLLAVQQYWLQYQYVDLEWCWLGDLEPVFSTIEIMHTCFNL